LIKETDNMKTRRGIIGLLLAVLLCSGSVIAQKVGSTSLQFLKVMPNARATAMGDAYVVLASGAEAVFWNPAGLAYAENYEFSLTYLKWIFDTQQGAISGAVSFGDWGSVGVQLQYVDFGTIDEALWVPPYTEDILYPGLTGRTFRPYAIVAGVSYAAAITNKFVTGITVKYAHESLYNGDRIDAVRGEFGTDTVDAKTWTDGLLFDFGINYNTGFRTIRIAASAQNFGANVQYAEESSVVPMSLRLGIAADLMGADALLLPAESSRLGIAFDLFQPNDYAQQAHFGVEYEFEKTVALRGGYKFGYDADGLTAGLGLKQMLGDLRLALDYSYGMLHYNLGDVHRISVGVKFQ